VEGVSKRSFCIARRRDRRDLGADSKSAIRWDSNRQFSRGGTKTRRDEEVLGKAFMIGRRSAPSEVGHHRFHAIIADRRKPSGLKWSKHGIGRNSATFRLDGLEMEADPSQVSDPCQQGDGCPKKSQVRTTKWHRRPIQSEVRMRCRSRIGCRNPRGDRFCSCAFP
jgi:hypothetical protein